MATRRQYGQVCSAARALDVVGERWTLLIVRNLSVGPRRYSELLAELPGITTNLLARRLREMSERGLICPAAERDAHGGADPQGYVLTELGQGLVPVVHALGNFGERLGPPDPRDAKSAQALLAGLMRRYRPGLFDGTAELEIEGRLVSLRCDGVGLRVTEGATPGAVFRLSGPLPVFGRALLAGEPLRALGDSFRLRGRRADVARLQRALAPRAAPRT